MPELQFSDFTTKHGTSCFAVSSAPYKGPTSQTDMNNRALPAPYQLLIDWCNSYLEKDWATTQTNNGLLLVAESANDENKIREMLIVSIKRKTTTASNATFPAKYDQVQYNGMAGDLGYVF